MKNKIKVMAALAVAAVAGLSAYNAINDVELTDLQKENLEALAGGVVNQKMRAISDEPEDVMAKKYDTICYKPLDKTLSCTGDGSLTCEPGSANC